MAHRKVGQVGGVSKQFLGEPSRGLYHEAGLAGYPGKFQSSLH